MSAPDSNLLETSILGKIKVMLNNSKIIKVSVQVLFFILLLNLSIACEDDALLAPQTGSEEETGSYGLLTFPGENDQLNQTSSNPEIF